MPTDLLDCPAETTPNPTETHLTLVCLPPGATHQPDLLATRVAAQLAPHTTGHVASHHAGAATGRADGRGSGPPGLICPNRFTAPTDLPAVARALLIDPQPASIPGLLRCAGGR